MATNDNHALHTAVTAAVDALTNDDHVRGIWLFGSANENRLWEGSDVDLLIVADGVAVHERRVEWQEYLFHLHWYPPEALDPAAGIPAAQRAAGGGRRLHPHESPNALPALELTPTGAPLWRAHLIPHLERLAHWARDLRQRMALGDERPRRAAARQWEVDNHAASILLIEAGRFPGAEPSRQALDERIFVPTMLDPDEIDLFVQTRLAGWVEPLWRDLVTAFDAADLAERAGLDPFPRLLDAAAAAGRLTFKHETGNADQPLGRRLYQPHDAR